MLKSPEEYLSALEFDAEEPGPPRLDAGERAFVEKYLGLDALGKIPESNPEPVPLEELLPPAPQLQPAPAPERKTFVLEPRIVVAPARPIIEVAPKIARPVTEIVGEEQSVAESVSTAVVEATETAVETAVDAPAQEAVEAPVEEAMQAPAAVEEVAEAVAAAPAAAADEVVAEEAAAVTAAVEAVVEETAAVVDAAEAPVEDTVATVVEEATEIAVEAPAQAAMAEIAETAATDIAAAEEIVEAPAETTPEAATVAECAVAAPVRPEAALREKMRKAAEIQMVSFFVAGQVFLLPVEGIQEVLRHMELIKVPQAPHFVAGAINLRGVVMPVVHLAALLTNAQPEPYGERNFIIITGCERSRMGLIIDKVNSMHLVRQARILWNPESKLAEAAEFLNALVDLDDRLCGMVSPEAITQLILPDA